MAGPIVTGVLLQQVTLTCPHCGYRKRVARKRVAGKPPVRRECPRCHKTLPDEPAR